MIHGIFSGVHSNLVALDAVLTEMRACGVEQHHFLGNVVGFGPRPRESLARIRELGPTAVSGSFDRAVAGGARGFSPETTRLTDWMREQLSSDDLHYLAELPLAQEHEYFDLDTVDEEIVTMYDAFRAFSEQEVPLRFVGQMASSGPTRIWSENAEGMHELTHAERFAFADGIAAVLVIVADVGWPEPNDSRASFCTFDDQEGVLEVVRVAYDLASVAADVRAAGLPEGLARRFA